MLAHKGGLRLVLGVGVILAGCTAGIEGCRCVLGLVSAIQDLDRSELVSGLGLVGIDCGGCCCFLLWPIPRFFWSLQS